MLMPAEMKQTNACPCQLAIPLSYVLQSLLTFFTSGQMTFELETGCDVQDVPLDIGLALADTTNTELRSTGEVC